MKGVPEHIRSDNGPEFTARVVRSWVGRVGAKTLFIESGSPWENGYVESFNGKLRDEFLDREIFYTLKEASDGVDVHEADFTTGQRFRQTQIPDKANGKYRAARADHANSRCTRYCWYSLVDRCPLDDIRARARRHRIPNRSDCWQRTRS